MTGFFSKMFNSVLYYGLFAIIIILLLIVLIYKILRRSKSEKIKEFISLYEQLFEGASFAFWLLLMIGGPWLLLITIFMVVASFS